MKVFKFAAKKGLPRAILHTNNLSSYDAEMLQVIYDDYNDAYVKHHRRNLYGHGDAPVRKHGVTKPRAKDKR